MGINNVIGGMPSFPPEIPNGLARLFMNNGEISFKYQIIPHILEKYQYLQLCEAITKEMQDYITATLYWLRTQGYEFIAIPQFKAGRDGEAIVDDWIYQNIDGRSLFFNERNIHNRSTTESMG